VDEHGRWCSKGKVSADMANTIVNGPSKTSEVVAGTPYRRSEYLNSGKQSEPTQWLLEKYRSRGRSAVRLWLSTIIKKLIM
jgi:hypothetical protein